MDASIILCTYNRCDALRLALEGLVRIDSPPGFTWEVLLVNNRSTDGTRALCESYVSEHPEHFRYLQESRPGKSYALNTGIREAVGDLLILTDDDCVVDPMWLQRIKDEFSADPNLAILGGRVELYNREDLPLSLLTSMHRTVVSKPVRLLFPRIHLIGCNLIIKREVFESVGLFDPNLGPGSRGESCEDFDLLFRALKHGFKIAYSPLPLVYHNHGRRTESDQSRLMAVYYVSRGAFYCLRWREKGVQKVIRLDAARLLRDFRYNFGDWALFRDRLFVLRKVFLGAFRMLFQRLPPDDVMPRRQPQHGDVTLRRTGEWT
jgi:GT2 family glycosyltransferase